MHSWFLICSSALACSMIRKDLWTTDSFFSCGLKIKKDLAKSDPCSLFTVNTNK